MLATVALVTLALGVGAGLLIANSDGDDSAQVRTVHDRTTVTAAAPATTPEAVTVTQPPAETVVRTATVAVTVTAPPAETGTTTTP